MLLSCLMSKRIKVAVERILRVVFLDAEHPTPAHVGEGLVIDEWSCSCTRYDETQGMPIGGHKKSLSLITSQELVFLSQLDFSHSMAHVTFHCAEPYFGGLLVAYGPQVVVL